MITVLSTGGTIASTGGDDGASPEKTGEDLVASLPHLGDLNVEARQISQRSSFDMDIETIEDIGLAAREAFADGADGVVVTHGTDTMEESAYYLDLALDVDGPIVFTGAQRRPDEVGPDGPANLTAAVRAVDHPEIQRDGGTYIAFDEELHAARDVTKRHTSELGTFTSPDKGPVATFTREGIRLYRPPGSYSEDIDAWGPNGDVRMVKSGASVDGRMIDACLEDDVDGIVLEGTGLGNATSALCDAVGRATSAGVPVVVTSRCHAGSTLPVYNSDGGGVSLVDQGAIHADDLPAHKARLKLLLVLDADDAQPAAYFGEYCE